MGGTSDIIKTHKITNKRLLLKKDSGLISTLYVLDKYDNKILSKNSYGRQLYCVDGSLRYDIAICKNENLI